MSPYPNFLAPRTSLSGRIQIGHKSGFIIYFIIIISSVNIKPTKHRFGFSLAWDWQNESNIILPVGVSLCLDISELLFLVH